MGRVPQRIVEAAIIDGIGPVTARELIALPEHRWGILRDRITDRRNGKDGLVARCMACEGALFIKTRAINGSKHPLFQHYNGADPSCPWHQARNVKPNDIRADQYQGRQESRFHRLMCEQVGQLAALDRRYIRHSVAEYLPPSQNDHGRFPDVYVEWNEFGPFAVEFQLSNTFQTEISARCKHYEYEGIPLLWILFGVDTATSELQQSFIDVIRRHRNNAFVLDMAAVAASHEQKTLVLTCYLRNGDQFDPPKLVRFDELHVPKSKLPYLEDRIAGPLIAEISDRRALWFRALDKWNPRDHTDLMPGLGRPQSLLVAAAFSIVASANGKERNYASNHENIRAMLNTYLSVGTLAHYVDLLQALIQNTARSNLLSTSVGDHLKKYRKAEQANQHSPEWRLLAELIPEALDPMVRTELIYLDALPTWAQPS